MPRRVSVAFFVAFAMLPATAVAQSVKVSLQIRSESWVDKGKFDEADFRKQCAATGVVAFGEPPDGLVLVEYNEAQGSSYFGGGNGTNIRYRLTVLSAKDAKTLLTVEQSASTPGAISSRTTLHEAAVSEFKSSQKYKNSCRLVAAALGAPAAPLLEWAVESKQGYEYLNQFKFTPSNASEDAFLAVARSDFAKAAQLGAASVRPLTQFIRSHLPYGSERFVLNLNERQRSELAAAITTLAGFRDRETPKLLVDVLDSFRNSDESSLKRNLPIVTAALSGLGSSGDAFTIADLEPWTKKAGETGAAATAASDQIRQRIVRR